MRINGNDWKRFKVDVPVGERGAWRIERFEIDKAGADLHNLRCSMRGQYGMLVSEGMYTRLNFKGSYDPVMSDTEFEIRSHREFIEQAHGDVLITGLGLGMVTRAVLMKSEVTSVTVIEREPDVIALVEPWLQEKYAIRCPLTVIEADALTWKPKRGQKYGAVWHDIWHTICEDDRQEKQMLRRRFVRRADWVGCWMD